MPSGGQSQQGCIVGERANQILAAAETLTLSPGDSSAFFAAVDEADNPRPALKAAALIVRQ